MTRFGNRYHMNYVRHVCYSFKEDCQVLNHQHKNLSDSYYYNPRLVTLNHERSFLHRPFPFPYRKHPITQVRSLPYYDYRYCIYLIHCNFFVPQLTDSCYWQVI